MAINANDFSERERNVLIFCLKNRVKQYKKEDADFLNCSKSWKNFYYYPLLTSRFKLEESSSKMFLKQERLLINSCVNDEITNKEGDFKLIEELNIILEKIN